MTFLIFINILAIGLAFLARTKGNRIFLLLSFILLTCIYSIRYDFGNDYWSYYEDFCNSYYFSISEMRTEIGWNILNIICHPIGFFGVVIITTIIENVIVYKFIVNNVNRKWWWLAVFIFVFTFNFMLLGCSMIRQYLAMTLCLYASQYIFKHNWIKFLIFIILAVLIHTSAIIFSITYIFAFLKFNYKSKVFISCFFIFIIYLLVISANLSNALEFLFTLSLFEGYETYSDWDEGKKSIPIILCQLLILLLILLKSPSKNNKLYPYIGILLINYLIWPFTFLIQIINRLQLYYSFFFIALIPYSLQSIRTKAISIGISVIYCLYLLKLFVNSITSETYGPYYSDFHTIFEAPNWL